MEEDCPASPVQTDTVTISCSNEANGDPLNQNSSPEISNFSNNETDVPSRYDPETEGATQNEREPDAGN